jgi:hypothetical protein
LVNINRPTTTTATITTPTATVRDLLAAESGAGIGPRAFGSIAIEASVGTGNQRRASAASCTPEGGGTCGIRERKRRGGVASAMCRIVGQEGWGSLCVQ